jgi:multidrug efflux pump subunit AcrB
VAAIAQTVQAALSGGDAAFLHDGQSKYPVPVRLQLPRDAQVGLDALLALPMRQPTASWCRCPNWCRWTGA